MSSREAVPDDLAGSGSPGRVALGPEAGPLTRAVLAAHPADVAEALALAGKLGALRPFVGEGATLDVWEALATLGSYDLAFARAIEPHVDALTILGQAGARPSPGSTWGVFAAEGPGARLTATPEGSGFRLRGTKPWCSLAGALTHALVTAWVDDDQRQLFAVDLRQQGVDVDQSWPALGLREIPSGPVSFDGVAATAVGGPGWYLRRPGFDWGGMSVAACWFGGATGVARTLLAAARERRGGDDTLLLMHLGQVDARLAEARTALASAASAVDADEHAVLLTKRVRATVASAAESVLRSVAHALGPAPLATDAVHAKRVADLELYLRQHHAERDDVSLGRSVRDGSTAW